MKIGPGGAYAYAKIRRHLEPLFFSHLTLTYAHVNRYPAPFGGAGDYGPVPIFMIHPASADRSEGIFDFLGLGRPKIYL